MALFSGQESLLFSTMGFRETPYRGNQGNGPADVILRFGPISRPAPPFFLMKRDDRSRKMRTILAYPSESVLAYRLVVFGSDAFLC